MPDAENYSDEGSDTLGNMAKKAWWFRFTKS